MGRVFDHIKGLAEQRAVDALWARRDQRTAYARTVALLFWSDAAGGD